MLAFALLPLLAAATPLHRRAVINHDQVQGFSETVPSGNPGQLYEAYKPYLKVENGCVPFPAVDAEGNTSGGLDITGSPEGDCDSSTGQIYVRAGSSNSSGYYALMYSWYFPKDNPSQDFGHRHDWEGVIVWLRDGTKTTNDNILAVCPSGHGEWACSTDGYSLNETSPLNRYYSLWPVNHQCGLTETQGGQQPMIAWESLPTAARNALEKTDFGDANVPFNDANFANNLDKATF